MATYFVAGSGSNTAPYDTWAKAATSLQTALTAANSAGDVVVVQANDVPATDGALASDTTYTFAASIALFAGTNLGGSDWGQTTMGVGNWIGNSALNRSIVLSGAFALYIYGITLRVGGTAGDNIRLSNTGGSRYLEQCYLWTNTSASSDFQMGGSTAAQSYVHLRGCTLRFGNTGQSILCSAGVTIFEEVVIDSAGSAVTTLLDFVSTASVNFSAFGSDFSAIASGATLVPDAPSATVEVVFTRCKLPTSYVALASQSDAMASARCWIHDCAASDIQNYYGYFDAYGSIETDSTNFFTSGAAGVAWKITTTALASKVWPFRSPWIDLYNSTLTTLTPYLEFLRNNGTAAAYTDQEVWAQFSVKDTSGFPIASLYSDRAANFTDAGTAQAAGAGTGSWTIAASSSPYSFKCDSGVSVTPAELGHIRARACVALPNISGTLFVDPQIRV